MPTNRPVQYLVSHYACVAYSKCLFLAAIIHLNLNDTTQIYMLIIRFLTGDTFSIEAK